MITKLYAILPSEGTGPTPLKVGDVGAVIAPDGLPITYRVVSEEETEQMRKMLPRSSPTGPTQEGKS